MAYTKNATVDSWDTANQLEYYKANPAEAQQEIARANSVGGSAANNWASQLQSGLPPTPQQASQGSSYTSAPVYAPPAPSYNYSSPAPNYSTPSTPSYSAPSSSYSGSANVIGNISGSSDLGKSYQSIYDSTRNSTNANSQLNTWADNTGSVYDTTKMTPQQINALMLNKSGNPNASAILSGMGLDINGNPVYAPAAPSYTKNAQVDAMPIDQQLEYYRAHPQEAQQEIARAQGIGGSAAQTWANQLSGMVPQYTASSQGGGQQGGASGVSSASTNNGATQLAGGGWAPGNNRADVEAEVARKFALALQEKKTIAEQQKAGLSTSFNRLRQGVNEDRTLQNAANERKLSPFSGRSDYARGIIERERAKADQQQQEDFATRTANIDQTLANYENASAEERQRMVDELVRQDRDFNYKVSRDQASDAASQAKAKADAEQTEIENAFKVGDKTGYLQLPQVTKAMNEITSNSDAWFKATPEEKQRLAARNQQLGASIGAWQNENGDWMTPDPVPTLAREKQEYDQVYTKYRDDIKDAKDQQKFDFDTKKFNLEYALDQAYKSGSLSIQARNAALSEAREARLSSENGSSSKNKQSSEINLLGDKLLTKYGKVEYGSDNQPRYKYPENEDKQAEAALEIINMDLSDSDTIKLLNKLGITEARAQELLGG